MIETPAPTVATGAKQRAPGLEKRLTERLLSNHVIPILPRVRAALELGPGRNPLLPSIEGDFVRLAVDIELRPVVARRFDEAWAGRAEALPLESQSVDLVMARWVFEHVEDGEATIAELARVLRPGGVCAFITPNARHPIFLASRILQRALPFALAKRVAARLAARPETSVFRAFYRLSRADTLRSLWAPHGDAVVELVQDPAYGIDLSSVTERLTPALRPYLVGRLER